jgi:hypothetical protein
MDNCKELFNEALRRLTAGRDETAAAVSHVWGRGHYKSPRLGGRFSQYQVRGDDQLLSDTERLSGQEAGDRGDDLSAGECSSEDSQWGNRGGVHSWFGDEFREILSKIDGSFRTVSWQEVDKDPELQICLYTHLGNGGILKLVDIPKIPKEYEPRGINYYGIDTEDDSLGRTHFYQFATREAVYFAGHWAVMMAFLARSGKRQLYGAQTLSMSLVILLKVGLLHQVLLMFSGLKED